MERRTLLWVSAGMVSGIYSMEYVVFLREYVWLLGAFAVIGACFAMGKPKLWMPVLLLTGAFLCGALLWQMEDRNFMNLSSYERQYVVLQGTAYGLEGLGDTLRLRACTLETTQGIRYLQKDVQLRLREGQTVPEGINGCRVQLYLRWQPATNPMNPRGFDYVSYLKRMGIQAELRIDKEQLVVGEIGQELDFTAMLYRIRSWYGNELTAHMPASEGTVAYGMAIGDTTLIPDDIKEGYRISGLGHLLSVSGLHFAIVYNWLSRMLSLTALSSKKKDGLLAGMLTFMAFLNGWHPSAARAWGMLLLLIVSKHLYRKYDGLCALYAITIATATVQPMSVLQPGFQLSYGAVLGLMTLLKPIEMRISRIDEDLRAYLAACISVQIIIMPLSVFWFGSGNPLTFLLNFPAMILAEWLMPLLLTVPLAHLLGKAGELIVYPLIRGLVWGMNGCSNFMQDQARDWIWASPGVGTLVLVLLLVAIAARLIAPVDGGEKRRHRINGLILTVMVILAAGNLHWSPHGEILFFSVGQGDAVLIRFDNKAILIDAGPKKAELSKLLLRNGITELDMLIITHGHEDHLGGAADILRRVKVQRLVVGAIEGGNPMFVDMLTLAEKKGVAIRSALAGDVLYDDGQRLMRVLYPEDNTPLDDPNGHSLTLLYEENGHRFMAAGDLPSDGENRLLEQNRVPQVDVMKASHHGSRTSNCQTWVDAACPKMVIVSTGPNLYGLPNRDIIERYNESGAAVYRTDHDGAVQVKLTPDRISLKTWR